MAYHRSDELEKKQWREEEHLLAMIALLVMLLDLMVLVLLLQVYHLDLVVEQSRR